MSYIVQADIEKRLTAEELVQLSDYDADGSGDPDVVAQTIADAQALVDSYVGARTAVPLTTVPGHIVTLTCNMAIYYLYLRRRSVTDDVRKQYDADVAYLRDVATGKVTLGDAGQAAGEPHPTAKHQEQPRLFDREKLRDF
jgi:phage gp36-like protein